MEWRCHNPSFGLTTKARACKVTGQEGSSEVTSHVSGSAKECEWMNLHTPKWTLILRVGVQNGFTNLQRAITGVKIQWIEAFFYIIGKLLELRCLKWARMTHLNIWNTSYGQKNGRESNWQFDFRPLQVKNRPDILMCKWHVTYCWKLLTRDTTLL
jgi:hypothetical protein